MIMEFINNHNKNDIKLSLEDLDKLLRYKYIYHIKYKGELLKKFKNSEFIIVFIKMNDSISLEKISKKLDEIYEFFKTAEITVVTNSNYKDMEIDLLIGINDLNLISNQFSRPFIMKL